MSQVRLRSVLTIGFACIAALATAFIAISAVRIAGEPQRDKSFVNPGLPRTLMTRGADWFEETPSRASPNGAEAGLERFEYAELPVLVRGDVKSSERLSVVIDTTTFSDGALYPALTICYSADRVILDILPMDIEFDIAERAMATIKHNTDGESSVYDPTMVRGRPAVAREPGEQMWEGDGIQPIVSRYPGTLEWAEPVGDGTLLMRYALIADAPVSALKVIAVGLEPAKYAHSQ